jgi:hypothetical protein
VATPARNLPLAFLVLFEHGSWSICRRVVGYHEAPQPNGRGIFSQRFVGNGIPAWPAGRPPKQKLFATPTGSRPGYFAKGDKYIFRQQKNRLSAAFTTFSNLYLVTTISGVTPLTVSAVALTVTLPFPSTIISYPVWKSGSHAATATPLPFPLFTRGSTGSSET